MYVNYTIKQGIPIGYLRKIWLIMRLTTVILMATFIQVSASSLAQKISLYKANAPLKAVIKELQVQSGYGFVYTDQLLEKTKPVHIKLVDASLEEALKKLFEGTELTYSINSKTVIIEPKVPSFLDRLAERWAAIDVTGRVLDEQGKPLPGASVRVKGGAKLTATNKDGEFSLKDVAEDAVLLISYVGYKILEIPLKDAVMPLEIKLNVQTGELEEVKVNFSTGFQHIAKERATGSFTHLNQEQLDQRIAPDIISKLEGITNGLVFNKNRSTGESELRVRGESTIFANANPLIVVDNFPYDGDINRINPNDVESVTVLKDAAAASIWGVQAANGVIVITTKRGRLNQPLKVNLTSNFTLQEKPDLYYAPTISPSDYIDLEAFLFDKGYYDARLNSVDKQVVSPVVDILAKKRAGSLNADQAKAQMDAYRTIDFREEQLKYIYRKPFLQQHQLNFNGGTNNSTYYFSAGYDRNLGMKIGDDNNRLVLNTQNTYRPLKTLEFSLCITYTATKAQNNSVPLLNTFPYTPLKDEQGNELPVPQLRADFENSIEQKGFVNWQYFPLQERDHRDVNTKSNDIRFITGLKLDIIKGLNLDIKYQFARTFNTGRNYLDRESYFIRRSINRFATTDVNGNYIGSNYPTVGGTLTINTAEQQSHYGRGALNYNRHWQSHALSAIAGIELRENTLESNQTDFFGYSAENGSYAILNLFQMYPLYFGGSASLGSQPSGKLPGSLNRFRTYFGNAAYTYLNKYTLSGSLRLDGSNYFGVKTNQKVVPLWSAGLKWDVNKESFFKTNFLSLLSLRTTYGFNGNLATNLAAITTLKYELSDFNTGLPSATVNNIPNPELRWERMGQWNVGLDFAFKNNWLSGSLEYYQKNGKDLIGDAPIDPTTGVTILRGNFSGLKTRGIDMQLNSININRGLKWSTNLIFNYAVESVTKYDIPVTPAGIVGGAGNIQPQIGKPLRSLYTYQFAGLDPATGIARAYLGGVANGNMADFQAAGRLSLDDLHYFGSVNPPVAGGMQNTVSWKGWTLTANLTYKLGYHFLRNSVNNGLIIPGLGVLSQDIHADFNQRWQKQGDEMITNVPAFIYPVNNSNSSSLYGNSDVLVEKGDHIRLQFANLAYTWNKNQLKGYPVQSLQFSLQVKNIGILWRANDKGIDPDLSRPNIGSYPESRTFSFGLSAGF